MWKDFIPSDLERFRWSIHHETLTECEGQLVCSNDVENYVIIDAAHNQLLWQCIKLCECASNPVRKAKITFPTGLSGSAKDPVSVKWIRRNVTVKEEETDNAVAPLVCVPAVWGRKMPLGTTTLSSEFLAQSTMPFRPFMGKLISVITDTAGSLWMLATGGKKIKQTPVLWRLTSCSFFFFFFF